jgi:glycine cleavage system H lipoate-binding protein
MAVALVILTVAALIALDYFVFRKRREARSGATMRLPGLKHLSQAVRRVPEGVFLHPTFTWSRIREDGEVLVGVHPLLLGLLGGPYRFELKDRGEQLNKGAPLLHIQREGRQLALAAPFAGRITAVNHVVVGETEWQGLDDEDGRWLYRIRPDRMAEEVPGWMIADRAIAWTKGQYEAIRSYLAQAGGVQELGVTMADGGEIPIGILSSLDDTRWTDFQNTFLTP